MLQKFPAKYLFVVIKDIIFTVSINPLIKTFFMTRSEIRKAIGGKALLNYEENPAFISFRLLNSAAANSALKKLILSGYNAKIIEKVYIKVSAA